jgi:hypothetical protein
MYECARSRILGLEMLARGLVDLTSLLDWRQTGRNLFQRDLTGTRFEVQTAGKSMSSLSDSFLAISRFDSERMKPSVKFE